VVYLCFLSLEYFSLGVDLFPFQFLVIYAAQPSTETVMKEADRAVNDAKDR